MYYAQLQCDKVEIKIVNLIQNIEFRQNRNLLLFRQVRELFEQRIPRSHTVLGEMQASPQDGTWI